MTRYADPGHRYRLDSRIATGGMGEVWRGTDATLDREVAIKLLKAEYADDPAFRVRFETEARHAAALHHPNVASVFDFGDSEEQRPYLVMELVDGQPLSALLRRGTQMPPDHATALLLQAADGLAAAHKVGIVHRDVKPANLIVTRDRTVKITDFGIARAADGMALTQTGQVMGTPQYLAPEQAEGKSATAASDVYSLGAVLYECLAGRRPFTGETPVATALAHVREPVPELPANVPPDLAGIVYRCLAKDPADRFKNAAALAAALRDPSQARTAVLPPVVAPAASTAVLTGVTPARADLGGPIPPPRRRVSPWLLAIPILVLLGLVAFALWQGMSDDDDDPSTEPDRSPVRSSSATSAPTTESSPEPIVVNPDDCNGNISDVTNRLAELGLAVNPVELENPGDQQPNEVESCTPTGTVQPDQTIDVSYWGEPAEEPPATDSPTVTETETIIEETDGPGQGNGNGNGNGLGNDDGDD